MVSTPQPREGDPAGRGTRELLCIATTLGPRVDVELLAAVTGLTEEALAERLAAPERLQLITATDEGYAFPGAVIAAVLQDLGLTPGRRREWLWRLELLAKAGARDTLAGEAIALGRHLMTGDDRHGGRRALQLVDGVEEPLSQDCRQEWLELRRWLDGEGVERTT